MVEAFEWPARVETVFMSTPAINCKVMLVCLNECSVTCGKPAFSRVLCNHTMNKPGDMLVPSSVQNNRSVLPSLSPRYFFLFCQCVSYSFKYLISLSGIDIVRFDVSVLGSLL